MNKDNMSYCQFLKYIQYEKVENYQAFCIETELEVFEIYGSFEKNNGEQMFEFKCFLNTDKVSITKVWEEK